MRLVTDVAFELARGRWLRGETALPIVEMLIERECPMEAALVARAALEQPDCSDASRLEELLYSIHETPPDWNDALAAFAANPSVDRWRELMLFVPDDALYDRIRDSMRRLHQLGVDGNILFLCSCLFGMTPDAIGFAQDGLVDPEVIVERANDAGDARPSYLGLAAIAAFRRKDMWKVVKLLREAIAPANPARELAIPHILFIRGNATAEENQYMDDAAIPSGWDLR